MNPLLEILHCNIGWFSKIEKNEQRAVVKYLLEKISSKYLTLLSGDPHHEFQQTKIVGLVSQ
jgi:hypothetical protein